MRREMITWDEVEKLIDHLIPQFTVELDAILMLRQGGIIPGGLLAENLGTQEVYIADLEFPKEFELEKQRSDPRFLAWPTLRTFPDENCIAGKKVLVVAAAWGTGRCMSTLRSKISGAGGTPYTCVLHYNHQRSLFPQEKPDFFAAVTDAWIVYPWELEKGKTLLLSNLT